LAKKLDVEIAAMPSMMFRIATMMITTPAKVIHPDPLSTST
jgi:hypothetical protein